MRGAMEEAFRSSTPASHDSSTSQSCIISSVAPENNFIKADKKIEV